MLQLLTTGTSRFALAAALVFGAGAALAQECLGTAESLALTEAQSAEIKAKGLTFGYLTNNHADDFSRTLISGGEAACRLNGEGFS